MKYLIISSILTITALADIKFTSKCEKEVIKLINTSTQNIDIAVYSINNQKIIDSLVLAKQKGIKVKILTDRTQAFGKSSKVKTLKEQGFNIKINSKNRIMHHKFAIFDNKTAVEGSFNWTNSAATKNAEDCNIFINQNDIKTLKRRFRKLWKINKKDISECYFKNMDLEKTDRLKCKS